MVNYISMACKYTVPLSPRAIFLLRRLTSTVGVIYLLILSTTSEPDWSTYRNDCREFEELSVRQFRIRRTCPHHGAIPRYELNSFALDIVGCGYFVRAVVVLELGFQD